MRLTEFIEQAHAKIIEEWVAFAATLLPWAKGMDEKELRDHAVELLAAVVSDMKSPQSRAEQSEKSRGRSVQEAEYGDLASVGHRHASERWKTGLNLDELVSEYRALRASVLRLWAEAHGEKQSEMTRFNEAIDESLTEATSWYSEELNRTREQFLAILGHDLRNPLAAIVTGAQLLTRSESSIDDKQLRVATRILNSARRMDRMVNDLLDLTRTRLGGSIPVTPQRMNLTPVCQQVISELEAIYPDHRLRFDPEGDLDGEWDSDRLHQLVSNLVANALQYGRDHGPVNVVAREHGEEVVLRVHNEGEHIPENALKRIFEPMVRQSTQDGSTRNSTGMGLGLYIVREIVTAHGGTIGVTSSEQEGTAFTVNLPRHPPNRRTHADRLATGAIDGRTSASDRDERR
jgi:signal transduction histidine kinase